MILKSCRSEYPEIGKKILWLQKGREEGEECWLSSVANYCSVKYGSIWFYPFFVGFTVGSNDRFAISRQLSLIGQNNVTLRMKCVLGETLR